MEKVRRSHNKQVNSLLTSSADKVREDIDSSFNDPQPISVIEEIINHPYILFVENLETSLDIKDRILTGDNGGDKYLTKSQRETIALLRLIFNMQYPRTAKELRDQKPQFHKSDYHSCNTPI